MLNVVVDQSGVAVRRVQTLSQIFEEHPDKHRADGYANQRQSVCGLSFRSHDGSVEVISYLKLSGSRLSSIPSAVCACGYIRKGMVVLDPGSSTSCAKL